MKEHVIINRNRTITVPDSLKKIGIQYDHNVNTITFDCPRYPDEKPSVDMSQMQIFINYLLHDKTKGSSLAENVVIDENDDTIIHFDWIITKAVTPVSGPLSTLVCIKDVDNEGHELYHWNSDLIQKFTVGDGMENIEYIADMNPDLITQLLVRMDDVDFRTSPKVLQEYVNEYMTENPPRPSDEQVKKGISENAEMIQKSVDDFLNRNPLQLDPTLTDETKAAPANAVGKINDNLNILNDDFYNLKNYIIETSRPTTWDEVAKAVATKLAPKMYAIGDEFTSIWKDTVANAEYDNPLRINHFENVELEDGTLVPGMWLQTHYAQLKGVQFSHQRAFLACPDGLEVGTYYFTIESKWGNNVLAGDIVCFTTTINIPSGGRVSGCYGAPDQVKANWRIYTYSADGKTILETITPTFEAAGTDLGIQKHNTRNGNLNSTQEMAYGWNRWKTSAIRQYLNSDKPKGEWWVSQDEWDIAPDQLSNVDGYLCGIEPELLEVMLKVKVITYTNTVNDGGEADITYDKVILPSLEQMYITQQIAGEGESHAYYKELRGTDTKFPWYQNMPELVHYAIENHTSAQSVRLRSAHRGNAYNAWYVLSNGYVSYYYASFAGRFAPLVLIGTNPTISAPTDAE